MKDDPPSDRPRLVREITQLARQALRGTLSQTYRTCGQPGCRCHHGGPKHGPHSYMSYRGAAGKTTGYYVPPSAEAQVRAGVQAWADLQARLQQLAALNKARLLPPKAKKTKK